jgi:predicted CopG family antitoxin
MPATTIRVDTETRDELQSRGRMGESYDDVIRRLLAATRTRDGASTEHVRKPSTAPPKPLFVRQDRT